MKIRRFPRKKMISAITRKNRKFSDFAKKYENPRNSTCCGKLRSLNIINRCGKATLKKLWPHKASFVNNYLININYLYLRRNLEEMDKVGSQFL